MERNEDLILSNLAIKMNSHLNMPGDIQVPVIGVLAKSGEEDGYPGNECRQVVEPTCLMLLQDAVVVPIKINSTKEEMEEVMQKINGLFLPAGDTNIWEHGKDGSLVPSKYTIAGQKLIEIATRMNKAGTYFPVMSICLGFELFAAAIGNDLSIVEPCEKCVNYSTILDLTPLAVKSKFLKALSEEQLKRLQTADLCYNYHSFMVDRKKFLKNQLLSEFFNIISLSPSIDKSFKFVSMIEGKKYPFYGLQFHPEWCLHDFYDKSVNIAVVQTEETHSISRNIAKFFLSEAKKNGRVYHDKAELRKEVVVNAERQFDSVKGYIYLIDHP